MKSEEYNIYMFVNELLSHLSAYLLSNKIG